MFQSIALDSAVIVSKVTLICIVAFCPRILYFIKKVPKKVPLNTRVLKFEACNVWVGLFRVQATI